MSHGTSPPLVGRGYAETPGRATDPMSGSRSILLAKLRGGRKLVLAIITVRTTRTTRKIRRHRAHDLLSSHAHSLRGTMAAANPNSDFAGFEELDPPFTHGAITHRVFWTGDGSPVLVLHELLGSRLPPSVSAGGWRPAGSECSCPSSSASRGRTIGAAAVARCASRRGSPVCSGRPAPIVAWLHALRRT